MKKKKIILSLILFPILLISSYLFIGKWQVEQVKKKINSPIEIYGEKIENPIKYDSFSYNLFSFPLNIKIKNITTNLPQIKSTPPSKISIGNAEIKTLPLSKKAKISLDNLQYSIALKDKKEGLNIDLNIDNMNLQLNDTKKDHSPHIMSAENVICKVNDQALLSIDKMNSNYSSEKASVTLEKIKSLDPNSNFISSVFGNLDPERKEIDKITAELNHPKFTKEQLDQIKKFTDPKKELLDFLKANKSKYSFALAIIDQNYKISSAGTISLEDKFPESFFNLRICNLHSDEIKFNQINDSLRQKLFRFLTPKTIKEGEWQYSLIFKNNTLLCNNKTLMKNIIK